MATTTTLTPLLTDGAALDSDLIEKSCTVLGLLSNPARLRLAVAMYRHPNSTVTQLAEDVDLSPDRVSALLRPMRHARLVSYVVTGRSANYRITDELARSIVVTCLATR
ncbi:ArsR/SmtB family transcription factor [Dietzia sp. 179-F 9C3 NHS]|uniref:ArsR/SmtB family transcription factor n=1 Tax=Dietzia sp. 179-F 9C3 NHS TaxID=3374295 RepID=UPI0038799615